MFDLAKAFNASYNPVSGLYTRKDHLLKLVPRHLTDLRKKIHKLVKDNRYPAKLIVKILTEGYPNCPCCHKPITSPNMSGAKRDEFTKTCGRDQCLRWYLQQGSAYGKALQAKSKSGVKGLVKPYMTVVKENSFSFTIRCSRLHRLHERNRYNAFRHCTCSKGEKVRDTRAANQEFEKNARVTALRANLPSTLKLVKVHAKQSKVDLKCSDCGKTQTKWLCTASGWKCGCEKQTRMRPYWDSIKQDTHDRVRAHLKSLKAELIKVTDEGYLVRCKCGVEFIPNQPLYLKYGCVSCAAKDASPARRAASKATCLERYGVEYAIQYAPIQDKVIASGYKVKSYKLGNRTVKVRGYEPQALDYILAKGIAPKHIFVGHGVPTVRYKYKGIDRVYFPDILLRAPGKRDMLVEVKSTWTLQLDTAKILMKKKAAEAAGYAFTLLVMTQDGVRLDTDKELKRCRKLLKAKC